MLEQKNQTKPKIKTHKEWLYFFNCKDSLNTFVLVEAASLVAWTQLYIDEHEDLSVDIQISTSLLWVVTCLPHLLKLI